MALRTATAVSAIWGCRPSSSGRNSRGCAMPMLRRLPSVRRAGAVESGVRVNTVMCGLSTPSVPPDMTKGMRSSTSSVEMPRKGASAPASVTVAYSRVKSLTPPFPSVFPRMARIDFGSIPPALISLIRPEVSPGPEVGMRTTSTEDRGMLFHAFALSEHHGARDRASLGKSQIAESSSCRRRKSLHLMQAFRQGFREGRRRDREHPPAQLAQHEFGGRHIPCVDRHPDEAHAEIAGWRADFDLERNRIATVHQSPQHLERIGFRHHVEAQIAPRRDFVENLTAAERAVRQRRRILRAF